MLSSQKKFMLIRLNLLRGEKHVSLGPVMSNCADMVVVIEAMSGNYSTGVAIENEKKSG